jgi:osmotically inducible lipoprotein OsmB
MNMYAKTVTATVIVAMLSACGNSPGERALSGGAIGAGAGAVGAAILSADPITGAVVGGAVGAVTGAATNKKQIDLGDIK